MAKTEGFLATPTPAGWEQEKQAAFHIETLTSIRPQRILEIGVSVGKWAALARQSCERPDCLSDQSRWKVHIERIVPLGVWMQAMPSVHDCIIPADEKELLSIVKKGADLIILDDILGHWSKAIAMEILDTAMEAAEYVLVSNDIAADDGIRGRDRYSSWTFCEFLKHNLVRFCICNEPAEMNCGLFLLSANDPKALRTRSFAADVFRVHCNDLLRLGTESVCGPGSSLSQTDEIRRMLPVLISETGARSFLDAPCGDFNWMRHVALPVDRYIGIDALRELILENQRKFGGPQRSFINLDIIHDELPQVDLIFCRDCLVHFSYEDIFNSLKHFRNSGSQYLLTTTFPQWQGNKQINTGQWRPLNLQIYPFDFPPPLRTINEKCTENDCRYSDKSLSLWRLADLPLLTN